MRGSRGKKKREKGRGVPVVSVDYTWMNGKKGGGDEEEKGNPIMVVHCRDSNVAWSRAALENGVHRVSIEVLSDAICSLVL